MKQISQLKMETKLHKQTDKNVLKPKGILKAKLKGWGERDSFSVSEARATGSDNLQAVPNTEPSRRGRYRKYGS